jgi:hypothetical protein
MTENRVRLWDASRQSAYVKERDEALDRRLDEREGTTIARELDSVWATLTDDQQMALTYLVLTGARSCVAHCSDPLLSSLVDRGLLIWPPGVRPVLTDDLVTSFLIPPAVREALEKRIGEPVSEKARQDYVDMASRKFADHFTPLVTSEITDDPFRPLPADRDT